jgi:hypothetical protein
VIKKSKEGVDEQYKPERDTQAENARQLPVECRQWTVRTPSMTYEWSDNNGVKQTTAWSKTVRKAMVRGGAEYQVQEAMNHAVINWSKTYKNATQAHKQTHKHASQSILRVSRSKKQKYQFQHTARRVRE